MLKQSLLACILLATSSPAFAFYESDTMDLRGFVQAGGVIAEGRDHTYNWDPVGAVTGRFLVDARFKNNFRVELHAVEIYTTQSISSGQLVSAERSPALEHDFTHDLNKDIRLTIDRLNLKGSFDRVDFALGRQPINLATVFYFTPNDFFAPFTPGTFFRVYKAGVDAARVDIHVTDLSQLSFIGVLGYPPDKATANGFGKTPDTGRGSLLTHLSITGLGWEWVGLAGPIQDRSVFGAALQGEPFEGLGFRAEGHYAKPTHGNPYSRMAVDLEHRFENGLTVRIEQYYNGEDPIRASLFSAENYTALGLGHPITPLFSAEGIVFVNGDDGSSLSSLYAVYSLSDETEWAGSLSIPIANDSQEFGNALYTLSVELRHYF